MIWGFGKGPEAAPVEPEASAVVENPYTTWTDMDRLKERRARVGREILAEEQNLNKPGDVLTDDRIKALQVERDQLEARIAELASDARHPFEDLEPALPAVEDARNFESVTSESQTGTTDDDDSDNRAQAQDLLDKKPIEEMNMAEVDLVTAELLKELESRIQQGEEEIATLQEWEEDNKKQFALVDEEMAKLRRKQEELTGQVGSLADWLKDASDSVTRLKKAKEGGELE